MAKAKVKERQFNPAEYAYPVCREQHVWKPYDGTVDEKAKVAYRVQVCDNCPTKKHSVISLRNADYGQLDSTRYSYPEDYQVPGGLDKRDKGRLRARNFFEELG